MNRSKEVRAICANEYLEYLRGLNLRISTLQEQIERERSRLTLTGLATGERVSKSRNNDAMSDGVIRLQELIERYCTELSEYVEQQEIAHNVFLSLSNSVHGVVLFQRYIAGKTWAEIGRDTHFSVKHAQRLKAASLDELYYSMPEQWRSVLPKAV